MRKLYSLNLLLFLFLGYHMALSQDFIEVALESGIDHAFKVDLATFGGGAAVFDFNNDGYEDVYMTGGNLNDALFKNNGDGTFTNVFDGAGFESTIPVHTQGVASADINRDGFKDLVITTMYLIENRELMPNLVYLNNGDGTFTDVTTRYGFDGYKSNSMSPTFGDINMDGYPDLIIINYFATSPNGVSVFNEQTITNNYAPAIDFLFINQGGEYFIESSQEYGMFHDGFGFQAIFTDFDNDRDPDIYIANDFGFKSTPNVLLRNDYPEEHLSYKANNLRLNYGMNAMGIAAGDYNFDGWMDYFVTNISESLFAINDEGQDFINGGVLTNLSLKLIQKPNYVGVPVSWGANFFDYDHDTDLDLYVTNGALNPTIRPNHNLLFKCNDGEYREVGGPLRVDDPSVGRGSVTFDYDNDGDLDLLVINQIPRDPISTLPDPRAQLYRNDGAVGNWLKVQLEGRQAESDGLGSRVEVMTNGKLLIREIDGGSSHQSHSSTIAHFGVGDAEVVESVTVKWLGGKDQVLENVAVNQLLTIRESGVIPPEAEGNIIKVFPSSFSDRIGIEYQLENDEPFEISVFGSNGQLIERIFRQSTGPTSGLRYWSRGKDLAPGLYLFQLRTNKEVIATKAIKI